MNFIAIFCGFFLINKNNQLVASPRHFIFFGVVKIHRCISTCSWSPSFDSLVPKIKLKTWNMDLNYFLWLTDMVNLFWKFFSISSILTSSCETLHIGFMVAHDLSLKVCTFEGAKLDSSFNVRMGLHIRSHIRVCTSFCTSPIVYTRIGSRQAH